MKLPISAMVVGYNESELLSNCLSSVSFCDEIIYTDLGSSDNSLEVAASFTNNIYKREKVPSGEYIQSEMVHVTKNEWVIFIDPDEMIDKVLQQQIIDEFYIIASNPHIGSVTVPWLFYFKNYRLKGTIWGGNNKKYLLVNKNRFEFLPITHYGRKLKEDFFNYNIVLNSYGTNLLHHYWVTSYSVFILKHLRYLEKEGIDQYNQGVRIRLKKIMLIPFKEFSFSFFKKKGYKNFLLGFGLSIFWSLYQTCIALDIILIQSQLKIVKKK